MEEYLIYDEHSEEFSKSDSSAELREAASEALSNFFDKDELPRTKAITYALCAISRSVDDLTEALHNHS